MSVRLHRITAILIIAAVILMTGLLVRAAAQRLTEHTGGITYYVSPSGNDAHNGTSPDTPLKTIQLALDRAQPGNTISLAAGIYQQDFTSRRDGMPDAPITITGLTNAVVQGTGRTYIAEIQHDYITLEGFTLDGLWSSAQRKDGYRDKLLYVLGTRPQDGVMGLRVLHMTFTHAGGECVRLRYFAQKNEIAYSTFINCGVYDFRFDGGGKNGEGIYIGTAPDQRSDGKNPTDDPDRSSNNWIHHNSFNTQGSECVDIKEGSTGNIVEYNTCTGMQDADSGGFDARGNDNTFRYNHSSGNAGAGVRLGGDNAQDGIDNHVYGNYLHDNGTGGINIQRTPQAQVCGNSIADNADGNITGSQEAHVDATAPCAFQ